MPQSDLRLRWSVDSSRWGPSPEEWAFLLRLVPEEDAAKVGKFVQEEDRKRALLSQLLQRAACHRALSVPFESARILRTKGGKPFLATPHSCAEAPNWNFNVSHEGNYVVLASEPLFVCGVDVAAPQQVRVQGGGRRQPMSEYLELFKRQFSAREQGLILRGATEEEKASVFRRLWSLKEAFVKARGDGLAFDLSRASFSFPIGAPGEAAVEVDGVHETGWHFSLQSLGSGPATCAGGEDAAEGTHWVTVARCTPEKIVDSAGQFKATLKMPELDVGDSRLCEPAPPFSMVTVYDLLPDELRAPYADVGGDAFG